MNFSRMLFGPLLLAALAVLLLALAGCGGSDDPEPSTEPPAAEQPVAPGGVVPEELEAQLEELRECIEDEGVDLSEAVEPPDPEDPDPELVEALQACQEFIPQGPAGGPGGPDAP